MPFRRRCLLFVPGDSERKLTRALNLDVDGLVFDLEDAVSPTAKVAARGITAAALSQVKPGCERIVRVNSLETGLTADDVAATSGARPDAYMLPKVSEPTEVVAVAEMIAAAEAAANRPREEIRLILVATETPRAVVNLPSLAAAHPRVSALVWGAEDLSAAIGARRIHRHDGRLLDVFAQTRALALLAAAAAGVDAIDTPYLQIGDLDGLRREAEEAAWMGFAGKAAIHPEQIPPIVELFTPGPTEVAEARGLLAEWERVGRPGTFSYKGRMVDAPTLRRAERILERV